MTDTNAATTVVTVPLIFTVPTGAWASEYDIPLSEAPTDILGRVEAACADNGIAEILAATWPMMDDFISTGTPVIAAPQPPQYEVDETVIVTAKGLGTYEARIVALHRNPNGKPNGIARVIVTQVIESNYDVVGLTQDVGVATFTKRPQAPTVAPTPAVEDLRLVDESELHARMRALNDEIARRNDNELFAEVCKVLAKHAADGSEQVPVEVRFPTQEYDNGYFYDEMNATVRFAGGTEETGVEFSEAEDALRALSDVHGALGATAGLSINVKTGDTDTDDDMFI